MPLKFSMILQNTVNYLHGFRKLIQNCSRTEIYLWPWYLFSFFHEICTILRGFWLFFAKFWLLLAAKFSNFPGLLHVFVDSVVNLRCSRKSERKSSNWENFWMQKIFGNCNSSGTSAKNYDGKDFLHFSILPEKVTKMIVLLRLLFCGKCQMIGRFLRWENFHWKLNSWDFSKYLVLLPALKTKIYQNFRKMTNIYVLFLKTFRSFWLIKNSNNWEICDNSWFGFSEVQHYLRKISSENLIKYVYM